MSDDIGGYDPVAKLKEINGDIYQSADWWADDLSDDYVLINVLHGDVYVAEVVDDPHDAHLFVVAEVQEGMTGDHLGGSDLMSNGLDNDDVKIVDVLGSDTRYVTEIND